MNWPWIFDCPSATAATNHQTYNFNTWLTMQADSDVVGRTDFAAAERVVFSDGNNNWMDNASCCDVTWQGVTFGYPHPRLVGRHNEQFNVAFYDGHVKSMNPTQMQRGQWNPGYSGYVAWTCLNATNTCPR